MRIVRWLICLAAFGVARPVHAENLAQLISDVRVLTLDASSSSRQHLSDSQLTTFLNQAQRESLAGSHCLQQTTVFPLVVGTTYYPLPSNYTVIERLTIGSKSIPQMTPAALDSQSLGWEYASGYPNRYFINFSSRGLVGFAPFPQGASDLDTIKVDYDVKANDLSAPTDVPFNGVGELEDYQHGLAYWTASTVEQINQQPARAGYYMALFQAVATQMRVKCRDLTNYKPGASGTP